MELSFREAQHPQGVRRIRKAAEPPTTAQQRGNPFPVSWPPCERGLASPQAMTEGFRFQDSFPMVGILPSRAAPVPPPFNKGGYWTWVTDRRVGPLGLLAMTETLANNRFA